MQCEILDTIRKTMHMFIYIYIYVLLWRYCTNIRLHDNGLGETLGESSCEVSGKGFDEANGGAVPVLNV